MPDAKKGASRIPSKNIRWDLDPLRVQEQVQQKIASLEDFREELRKQARENMAAYEKAKLDGSAKRWSTPPADPENAADWIPDEIELQRTYYSKVRVIELPKRGNRFILGYGDTNDETVTNGTGPFESFTKAADWFYSSGR